MSTPYVGEIRTVGFNFAPVDWSFCDGTTLAISQYAALFDLLGTTYGGDGVSTFKLPDLRSRVPVHQGSSYVIGAAAGEETVTLTLTQIPAHTHTIGAQTAAGTAQSPSGAVFAASDVPEYGTSANGVSGQVLQAAGNSLGHSNLMPVVAINYIISLYGVFPSRN